MKPKKVKYPIHKMGKHCGYDEHEDGSIKVAPIHSDKMDKILMEERAVDVLLKSVTGHCHQLLISLIERKHLFWNSLREDYPLDEDKYQYYYNPDSKTITREEVVKEADHV